MPTPQPTLTTSRLILRPYGLDLKADLIRLIGDPLVSGQLKVVPYPYTEKDADEWISSRQKGFDEGDGASYAITLKTTGNLVGGTGISINSRANRAEVGYWIGRQFWGQGYATEAVKAFIDWVFETTNLNRIFAEHVISNPKSGRVMQKLGMQFEGILRQHTCKDGVYLDLVYYGILRSEWRAGNYLSEPGS